MREAEPLHGVRTTIRHRGPLRCRGGAARQPQSGILLETLRHDVTPAGLHYLLNHFDVPYVPDARLAASRSAAA